MEKAVISALLKICEQLNCGKGELVKMVRSELQKEHLVTENLSYLSEDLESWWSHQEQQANIHFLKLKLANFFLEHLKQDHLNLLGVLGENHHHIAAVCFTNIFNKDYPKLALVVHEALSELFHLTDIKYPYEDHKSLYLMPDGVNYKDWGNGYGKISPHSDDLYEDISTDYLSLTVCRDNTNTPTSCFFLKDIFSGFSDDDMAYLLEMEVKLISGKNVKGRTIEKTKKLIEFDSFYGIIANLDFRIDDIVGERMRSFTNRGNQLLKKLRGNIANACFEESVAKVGTFFIVANHKVLHSRGTMNININNLNLASSQNSPRLLFRSKGNRKSNTFNEITKISEEYIV